MPGLVLLVEDEAPLRDLLAKILTRHGYEVALASNASEAIESLSTLAPALSAAVVDLTLPDASGDSVLNAARATRSDLHLIATSGIAFAGDRYPLREGEAAYCLSKPFLPRALLALLAQSAASKEV